MDAAAALERLREISSQVRAAVIFERGGKVVGLDVRRRPACEGRRGGGRGATDRSRASGATPAARPRVRAARGRAPGRERLRRPGRRSPDRGDDAAGADVGSSSTTSRAALRDLDTAARRRNARPEAQACEPGEENRCEVVTFSPACCWARARSPGRCSSAGASRASESGWTCTSATGRWSRWRSQARLSRCLRRARRILELAN